MHGEMQHKMVQQDTMPLKLALRKRSALTLVELLVVIVILTLLVAAVIPVLSPATETRRLREASRQLNSLCSAAQAKAISSGKPVGLWLEKLSTQTGQKSDRGGVMTVFICEEPLAFSGFLQDSSAQVRFDSSSGYWIVHFIRNYIDPNNSNNSYPHDLAPPNMLRPGDRISIDGAVFILEENSNDKKLDPTTGFFGPQPLEEIYCRLAPGYRRDDWNFAFSLEGHNWTYPKQYSIHRLPQKSANDPLQLPAGIVIDLEASGVSGAQDHFFHDPVPRDSSKQNIKNDNDAPIVIMFGPDGSVNRIYQDVGFVDTPNNINNTAPIAYNPHGSVYFLIGLRENIGATTATPTTDPLNAVPNWLDPASLWVSFNTQTGRTVTAENAPVDWNAIRSASYTGTPAKEKTYKKLATARYAAREFVTSTLTKGGK